tara:strand:+ start:136 stop:873 length:738 start_codon:yes stop_codon:yes gene_type:complete
MFDLDGKVALVTGASGAIGSAISRDLVDRGAKVALSGTRIDVLEQLAAELSGFGYVIPANLSDIVAVEKLVSDTIQVVGGLDILVNNAGVTRDNLAIRLNDDDWDNVIEVNLAATFRLSRSVLRGMMKNRWGRIINISSIVGVMGNVGQANYAASKAGVIGMSKALAQEVASRGITVNCIAPGFIVSAMTDSLNEDQREKLLVKIPARQLGNPKDVASACVYLASDEASYVTGQTLHVNGGMVMV